jgi:hypothetical protein
MASTESTDITLFHEIIIPLFRLYRFLFLLRFNSALW